MQSPDHTPGLAKSTPRSRCGRRCAAGMGPACSECMQRVLESESAAVGFPNGDAGRPDRFPETEMADGQLVQLLAAAQMEDVANSLVCPEGNQGRPKIAAFREWILGPASGAIRPAAIRGSVDSPEPLRPARQIRSPGAIARPALVRRGVPPNVRLISCSRRAGPRRRHHVGSGTRALRYGMRPRSIICHPDCPQLHGLSGKTT